MDLWKRGLYYLEIDYVWGGNNPESGFDCSGFVLYLLRQANLIGVGDMTAQGIFDKFRCEFIKPESNALLFFGRDFQSITHVAISIDETFMIEAGGEGRVSTNKGKVRIKPINNRKDLLCCLKTNREN